MIGRGLLAGRAAWASMLGAIVGCAPLPLDPPEPVAWVVYDPASGAVPLPNDLVRDDDAGHLALPTDDPALTPGDVALRQALNTQDAWSTVAGIAFEASSALDPASVGAATIEVWEWSVTPTRVDGLAPILGDDGRTVRIAPPIPGWAPGGRYYVVVHGLTTVDGVEVGADAAFAYLRSAEPLTGHDRAFPGADRAEREAVAAQLEAIRLDIAPYVDAAVASGVDRQAIAALWTFTTTRRPELAMDAASQRMPLPIDLLVDPATGRVALPENPADSALEADAKRVANTLDGFGITADLTFEVTLPLDPATVNADTVELWDLTATPVRVPAGVTAWRRGGPCAEPGPADDGCVYVVVDPYPVDAVNPVAMPLDPGTTYAVLVRDGITDPYGAHLAAMPPGQLLALDAQVADGAVSVISGVPDDDAARVEPLRQAVDVLLDAVGRDGVVTAWPFTTFDRLQALRDTVDLASTAGLDPRPTVTDRGPASQLFGADPLSDLFPGLLNPADLVYLPRVDGVAEVIEGTIRSPVHLDPVTRRWREPPVGDDIAFLATVPEGIPDDEPVPVVIFGHAVVTDRRFLLTISGALAKRGFAAVSIDFPYHGERIACVDASLVAIPNFFPTSLQGLIGQTGPLLYANPCTSGADATCAPTGECLGPNGQVEPFAAFPIVDIRPASGAAFLDVHDLPHIPDHFRQALVDLGALRYSLVAAQPQWEEALGRAIRTDAFLYAGQSLGGIIGAVYVAADPSIARAVLNVPGADMVDMFADSTFFGPQMDVFLDEQGIVKGTWDHERLLNVAHWLIDSVDPASVAQVYRTDADRVQALIQMDRIDADSGDIVIPNASTDVLAAVSGLPVIEYPSVLHGDLVIPLIGDAMVEDLGAFLVEGAP